MLLAVHSPQTLPLQLLLEHPDHPTKQILTQQFFTLSKQGKWIKINAAAMQGPRPTYLLWSLSDGAQFGQQAKKTTILHLLQKHREMENVVCEYYTDA